MGAMRLTCWLVLLFTAALIADTGICTESMRTAAQFDTNRTRSAEVEAGSTLTLSFEGQRFLLNNGGLLRIFRRASSGYGPYQLAQLVKSSSSATVEVFLTSPSDVRPTSTSIFPINPVVGKWPSPPPRLDSSSAQVRVVKPGDPNRSPGNSFDSGVVKDLAIRPQDDDKFTATGYIEGYGSSNTTLIGYFSVYGIYVDRDPPHFEAVA